LSAAAATMNPSWATTSYGLFAVDGGCLLALIVLALNSNRYWPIWAMGFQTVAVATHMATLWIPDFLPKSYQALLSFWAIPILWVMVMGTRKDRQYERGKVQLACDNAFPEHCISKRCDIDRSRLRGRACA